MAEEPEHPSRRPARRELDEVFGEVLPETTSDERELGEPSPAPDDWYLQNRPPHHS